MALTHAELKMSLLIKLLNIRSCVAYYLVRYDEKCQNYECQCVSF